MRLWRAALLLSVTLAAAGCARRPAAPEYELSGQVLVVRPERDEIVIRHDDIAGFMPGMTMPFRVRDRRWLEAATPGDWVHARLVLAEDGPYLSEIRPTGRRDALPEGFEAPVVMELPVDPGATLPDVALVDQLGRAFSSRELRGSPYAVTFTYTRCPVPTYCPAQDRRFAELQRAIRQQPGLETARLLSISIDPEHDRPEVLATHAETLGAEPSIWRFATGERDAILAFASSLGVSVVAEAPGSEELLHSVRTAVVGADGRLIRRYDGTGWQVRDVLRDLAEAQ